MVSYKNKTRKLADDLRLLEPCPVNYGITVKLTQESFVRSCRQKASKSISYGVIGSRACDICKIRGKIKRGESFNPPGGIIFFEEGEYSELVKMYSGRIFTFDEVMV